VAVYYPTVSTAAFTKSGSKKPSECESFENSGFLRFLPRSSRNILINECLVWLNVFNYPEDRQISMKNYTAQVVYGTIGAITLGWATQVQAQIVPTPIGDLGATGTIVTPTNTQIDITGGTQAGSTLFHSFTQFDISKGQTANFQTPTDVQNVLTRVTNGVPSTIDGTLQLSGAKANLYFMNPAGIVFGPNANLNLPASFVGTTASNIHLVDLSKPPEIPGMPVFSSDFVFNAIGQNNYGAMNQSGKFEPFQLGFANNATGSIINFGKLSLSGGFNNTLALIGQTVWSPAEIKTDSNLSIGAAVPSPSIFWPLNFLHNPYNRFIQFTARAQSFSQATPSEQPLLPASISIPSLAELANRSTSLFTTSIPSVPTSINPGDIVVSNIDAGGFVQLRNFTDGTSIIAGNITSTGGVELDNGEPILPALGNNHRIQVGNIEAEKIRLSTSSDIIAGHLKTTGTKDIFFTHERGIQIQSGGDITIQSALATSPRGYWEGSIGIYNAGIYKRGIFRADSTIPDNSVGGVSSNIKPESPESITSIAASGGIYINNFYSSDASTSWLEGSNLEHDLHGNIVYRLASNSETQVDIIAINPQNGGLVLKNQASGEIIIGEKVVVRPSNSGRPLGISGTNGLVVQLDRKNKSLTALSRPSKAESETDNAEQYVSTIHIEQGSKKIVEGSSLPGSQRIKIVYPNGYSSSEVQESSLVPLPADIQAAIDQHNQKTAAIATPAPTLTPIAPTPESTPEPTPEPATPNFDRTSILTGTIDPTDTINLSAGAIRGATINPGGLLKVELDTRNPEGVLTRKVTK
jgi:filamentous hemagglutinin family protein